MIVRLGERAAAERDADLVRTGRRREADLLEPRVDLFHHAALDLVVRAHVFLAADDRLVDRLTVHDDDDMVLELHVVAPDMGRHIGDVDLVLAVGREVVLDDQAAARAERQALHVRLLKAGSRVIRLAAGPHVGPPDRLHGDHARRADVLLDERRRDLQPARNVVEVLDDLVERQERRRVDVDREQVADRVLVFLAVQPVRRNRFRPALVGRGLIERALEPRDQARELLLARARRLRGRHQPAAELAHGRLEDLGVIGDLVAGDPVEREIAREFDLVVALGTVPLDRPPVLLAGLGDRGVFPDPPAACREHERRERSRLFDHGLTRSLDSVDCTWSSPQG